jgi:hypothetical protein
MVVRQNKPFKPKGEATDEKVYTKAWESHSD